MTQAYPLQWPVERPRTPAHKREASRFDVSPGKAQKELIWECERMGGRNLVLSTNIQLRRDGFPYANRRAPDDPAVAVYFERKGQTVCFSCDRYSKVWENMRAISKTIYAMRGIDRWGAHEVLDQMFRGFTALPSPDMITPAPNNSWWMALLCDSDASASEVTHAFKDLVRERGGTTAELNQAKADGLAAAQQRADA